jgi:hypothetical protein
MVDDGQFSFGEPCNDADSGMEHDGVQLKQCELKWNSYIQIAHKKKDADTNYWAPQIMEKIQNTQEKVIVASAHSYVWKYFIERFALKLENGAIGVKTCEPYADSKLENGAIAAIVINSAGNITDCRAILKGPYDWWEKDHAVVHAKVTASPIHIPADSKLVFVIRHGESWWNANEVLLHGKSWSKNPVVQTARATGTDCFENVFKGFGILHTENSDGFPRTRSSMKSVLKYDGTCKWNWRYPDSPLNDRGWRDAWIIYQMRQQFAASQQCKDQTS